MQIGFIGTGIMGTGIIKNFLRAGHVVTVYNRTPAHAQAVLDADAKWADSPRAVAAVSDVTFTMVGFPRDVEQVYFGSDGVLAGAKPGSTVVDMTTSQPVLAARIAQAAAKQSVRAWMRRFLAGTSARKKGR